MTERTKDLRDRRGPGEFGWQGVERIDAGALGDALAAEERQEGRILEQQQTACFVLAGVLPGIMRRVGEGGGVQRTGGLARALTVRPPR